MLAYLSLVAGVTAYHVGARGEDVRARETRSLTAASVRPPDPCTRASQPPQRPLNYIFSATRRVCRAYWTQG